MAQNTPMEAENSPAQPDEMTVETPQTIVQVIEHAPITLDDINARLAALDEAQDIVLLHIGPNSELSTKLVAIANSVQEGIKLGVDNNSLSLELNNAAELLQEAIQPNCDCAWNSKRFHGEVLPQLTDLVGLDKVINQISVTGQNHNTFFDVAEAEDLAQLRANWMAQAQGCLAAHWHRPLAEAIATSDRLEAMLVSNLDQVRVVARPPWWHRVLRVAAIGLSFAAAMVVGIAVSRPELGLPSLSWLLSHIVLELVILSAGLGIWLAVIQDRAASRKAAAIHAQARKALRAALAAGVEVPITNLVAAQNRLAELSKNIAK